jgi:ATP-binding cassette subfamily B protein
MKKHFRIILRGLKFYAVFPKPILLSKTLSAMFNAGIPFINIWFSAQILNELTGSRNPERLLTLVLLTIGLNLAAVFLGNVISRWVNYCNSQLWFYLFNRLSDKMMSMDYADVEDIQIQQTHSQIRQHQNGMGFGFPRLMYAYDGMMDGVIRILLSVAFAFSLFTFKTPAGSALAFLDSTWMVLVVLLFLCWPIFISPYISMIGGRIWLKASDLNNEGNRIAMFFFHIMTHGSGRAKDIRMYDQKRLTDRLAKGSYVVDQWKKFAAYEGRLRALCVGFNHLSYGLIYLFVALKAFAGAFGVGSIIQYVGAIRQFGDGFGILFHLMGNLLNNNPYLEKALNFMDTPNRKHKGVLPVEKRVDNQYAIAFHNVSFKYPGSDVYALKNLSIQLQAGQRLAVVGMNGSGKTTMIKLLCRLYDPTDGMLTLNGVDIKEYNYDEYMAIFGVVFQDFALLPFTLGQNVAASVTYDRERVQEALVLSGFGERLAALPHGLDTYIDKHFEEDGVEMSGGEKQKIALARALYRNTPFIVLDEPTAALDPIAEYEIYTKFNEIVGGRTAVFISHRLSSCRFCDDIAVFHEGEMTERGSHDELVGITGGKYRELWNAQAQFYT